MTGALAGKTALVTGSTSGIGAGIARALAAEGAAVMLNGFGEPAEIERQCALLAGETGAEIRWHGADLARADEIAGLIEAAAAWRGRLDILVNNAGIQHTAPVERFPPEAWDRVLALNLTAVFHGIRLALPGMRAAGWGRIINIASVHALVASVEKSAYVAAKHGVIGLTRTVALETAGSGVTCNAICPGWVRTALVERQIERLAAEQGLEREAAARRLLLAKQPSGRFTTVEQIGGLAVFLSGPSAAEMTGAAITLDGGWTAQ